MILLQDYKVILDVFSRNSSWITVLRMDTFVKLSCFSTIMAKTQVIFEIVSKIQLCDTIPLHSKCS